MDDVITSLIRKHLSQIKYTCRVYAFKYKLDYATLLGNVLEKVWVYRGSYRVETGGRGFVNWANMIIRNHCVDHYRKRKKFPEIDIENAYNLPVAKSKDGLTVEHGAWKIIWRHLSRTLSDRELKIVRLLIKGIKQDDVAKMIGMNKNTLRANLRRMRAKFSGEEGRVFREYIINS